MEGRRPVSAKEAVVDELTVTPFLMIQYLVTPTLSVEAVQERLAELYLTLVTARLPGAVGGWVSGTGVGVGKGVGVEVGKGVGVDVGFGVGVGEVVGLMVTLVPVLPPGFKMLTLSEFR